MLVTDCEICRAPQLAVSMPRLLLFLAWCSAFRRWDEDGSGELEFEEQRRAMWEVETSWVEMKHGCGGAEELISSIWYSCTFTDCAFLPVYACAHHPSIDNDSHALLMSSVDTFWPGGGARLREEFPCGRGGHRRAAREPARRLVCFRHGQQWSYRSAGVHASQWWFGRYGAGHHALSEKRMRKLSKSKKKVIFWLRGGVVGDSLKLGMTSGEGWGGCNVIFRCRRWLIEWTNAHACLLQPLSVRKTKEPPVDRASCFATEKSAKIKVTQICLCVGLLGGFSPCSD